MGLDCSHDAWHGAYSNFHRLRLWVAGLAHAKWDGDIHRGDWVIDVRHAHILQEMPGVTLFLCHSDCEGEFTPEEAKQVAHSLEQLLVATGTMPEPQNPAQGMRGLPGSLAVQVVQFIKGCREAHAAGEPLEFR